MKALIFLRIDVFVYSHIQTRPVKQEPTPTAATEVLFLPYFVALTKKGYNIFWAERL